MGTDKQTNGWTNGRTNKQTNIYSIFRDKLSLPEESLDYVCLKEPPIRERKSFLGLV
jgi:hypothetical protein